MNVIEISYERIYPLASFVNERIGMKATLDEGENPIEAMNELRGKVDKCHVSPEENVLNSVQDYVSPSVKDAILPTLHVVKDPIEEQEQKIITEIRSCKSLKDLESYKLIAERNPVFLPVYNIKYSELKPANQEA